MRKSEKLLKWCKFLGLAKKWLGNNVMHCVKNMESLVLKALLWMGCYDKYDYPPPFLYSTIIFWLFINICHKRLKMSEEGKKKKQIRGLVMKDLSLNITEWSRIRNKTWFTLTSETNWTILETPPWTVTLIYL